MNCKEIQRYVLEYAGEKLNADVQQHLASCEACRQANERALLVCKLISLKKYEQPDAGFEARSLARIRSAITELEEERQRGWSLAEIFGAGPIPALRYAMAAAVLVLTGLNFVSVQNLPSLNSIAMEEPAAPVAKQVVASATNDGSLPVAMFRMVASNTEPGQIQYGPGPSRAVNFEY